MPAILTNSVIGVSVVALVVASFAVLWLLMVLEEEVTFLTKLFVGKPVVALSVTSSAFLPLVLGAVLNIFIKTFFGRWEVTLVLARFAWLMSFLIFLIDTFLEKSLVVLVDLIFSSASLKVVVGEVLNTLINASEISVVCSVVIIPKELVLLLT